MPGKTAAEGQPFIQVRQGGFQAEWDHLNGKRVGRQALRGIGQRLRDMIQVSREPFPDEIRDALMRLDRSSGSASRCG